MEPEHYFYPLLILVNLSDVFLFIKKVEFSTIGKAMMLVFDSGHFFIYICFCHLSEKSLISLTT